MTQINHVSDCLIESELRALLADTPARIQVFDALPSTNIAARAAADHGEEAGLVILAGSQTEGRGRLGRSFYSPGQTGIYLSVLLRPDCPLDTAPRLTAMAAVSVCQAIEEILGERPGIKWVNDIVLNGKKVCGILTESSWSPKTNRLCYAVVGIGLNVYPPENGFPPEIRDTAGALRSTVKQGLLNRLAATIIRRLLDASALFPGGPFLEEYRKRSVVIGHRIFVHSDGMVRSAEALAVENDCRLRVRYEDGTEESLSSGEISIRLDANQ